MKIVSGIYDMADTLNAFKALAKLVINIGENSFLQGYKDTQIPHKEKIRLSIDF